MAQSPGSVVLGLRTYKTAVYEMLRESIMELEAPPGARLVEADLAAQYSVSKTPVREALLKLETEGLVEIKPHHGATVSWLSLEQLGELHYLQDALEIPSLDLVTSRMGASDLVAMERLVDHCTQYRRERQSRKFSDSIVRFHEHLFGTVRYPLLSSMIRSVLHHERRYDKGIFHQFDDTWDLELEILTGRFECLRSGDHQAAVELVKSGHARLRAITEDRSSDPQVARYLARARSVRS